MKTLLAHVGRLFTAGQPVGEKVDVLLGEGSILAIGRSGTLPGAADAETFDCHGALLTAGLVDAHTHPLYAKARLAEVAERSTGASYAEIAARGGGIRATVRDTRDASWVELELGVRERLQNWLQAGTTTVEAKTGYWLEQEGELRAVRLLHALSADLLLPELVVSFLGAHALPEEFDGRRQDFVDEVSGWSGEARREGARFADVFCDQGAFTVVESAQFLRAAQDAGLELRIHADELALTGGTELAVELGAVSADHLLCIGAVQIAALARSATVATLCPVTALAMGRTPPARELVAAGARVALGSDHNPGTSGATSMSMVVWLAITELGLSVEQALTAATLGGALSLGLADRGQIVAGKSADLVLWDTDHEGGFGWSPDLRPLQVWRAGRICLADPSR
ncbi:MAG TPA: imidazolonepropionase [Candidatus Dormibacteraeota bacterium]|nr:imidazolonepropionase [Candidatus Dormibacteraeota bacterium]